MQCWQAPLREKQLSTAATFLAPELHVCIQCIHLTKVKYFLKPSGSQGFFHSAKQLHSLRLPLDRTLIHRRFIPSKSSLILMSLYSWDDWNMLSKVPHLRTHSYGFKADMLTTRLLRCDILQWELQNDNASPILKTCSELVSQLDLVINVTAWFCSFWSFCMGYFLFLNVLH